MWQKRNEHNQESTQSTTCDRPHQHMHCARKVLAPFPKLAKLWRWEEEEGEKKLKMTEKEIKREKRKFNHTTINSSSSHQSFYCYVDNEDEEVNNRRGKNNNDKTKGKVNYAFCMLLVYVWLQIYTHTHMHSSKQYLSFIYFFLLGESVSQFSLFCAPWLQAVYCNIWSPGSNGKNTNEIGLLDALFIRIVISIVIMFVIFVAGQFLHFRCNKTTYINRT